MHFASSFWLQRYPAMGVPPWKETLLAAGGCPLRRFSTSNIRCAECTAGGLHTTPESKLPFSLVGFYTGHTGPIGPHAPRRENSPTLRVSSSIEFPLAGLNNRHFDELRSSKTRKFRVRYKPYERSAHTQACSLQALRALCASSSMSAVSR